LIWVIALHASALACSLLGSGFTSWIQESSMDSKFLFLCPSSWFNIWNETSLLNGRHLIFLFPSKWRKLMEKLESPYPIYEQSITLRENYSSNKVESLQKGRRNSHKERAKIFPWAPRDLHFLRVSLHTLHIL